MIQTSNTRLSIISTVFFIGLAKITFHLLIVPNALASSDADYSFTLAFDRYDCQQIDSSYQSVYAFETPSFYVNICQKGNAYFYSGESKQSNLSSIFIPAHPLDNGSGFKAENGNVSYWVILPFGYQNNFPVSENNTSEAILTIKRNDILVSVESSLEKYCHQSETAIVWDTIELQPRNSNQIANIPQQQDIGADISLISQQDRLLPAEVFNSESRFDFYRIGGELHRLTTCN